MAPSQVLERWMPFDKSGGALLLDGLIDAGDEDFRLLFHSASHPGRRFSLRWRERPHAYRNIDERFRLRLWDELHTDGHLFWIMRNSTWVGEFHQDSHQVRSDLTLVHYAIYTGDDCIDVLSVSPPIAESADAPAREQ